MYIENALYYIRIRELAWADPTFARRVGFSGPLTKPLHAILHSHFHQLALMPRMSNVVCTREGSYPSFPLLTVGGITELALILPPKTLNDSKSLVGGASVVNACAEWPVISRTGRTRAVFGLLFPSIPLDLFRAVGRGICAWAASQGMAAGSTTRWRTPCCPTNPST